MGQISNYLRTVQAGHPFSAVMATGVIAIFMIKLDHAMATTVITIADILLIQLATGMINDYLDYDEDRVYQPEKPLNRYNITKDQVGHAIGAVLIAATVITVWIYPIDVVLVIIAGTILAQSYNFGLKNTPFSILVFTGAFGLMALIPFLLSNQTSLAEQPVGFLLSGGIIAVMLHMTNNLVDYEIDIKRDAQPFVVWIGRTRVFVIMGILAIIFTGLNVQIPQALPVIMINTIVIGLVYLGMTRDRRQLREFTYYLAVVAYIAILILLPIK